MEARKQSLLKRCKGRGKPAIWIIAGSLSLLSAPPAVQAGHWQLVPFPEDCPEEQWDAEVAKRWNGTSTLHSHSWAWSPYTFDGSMTQGGVLPNEGASAGENGQVRFIFRWVRDSAQDNPPEYLYVKLTGSALAQASSNEYQSNAGGTTSVSVLGNTGHASTPNTSPPYCTGREANVTKLVQVKTDGQDVVETPWYSLSANASVGGGRTGYGRVSAQVHMGASVDDRWVRIESSIGQTYHKGADTGQCDAEGRIFTRIANQRHKDGSITVDVVADWYEPISGSALLCQTTEWIKAPTFTAVYQNFQEPSFAWLGSGGSFSYDIDYDIFGSRPWNWVPQNIPASPCATGIRLGGRKWPSATLNQGMPVRHSLV